MKKSIAKITIRPQSVRDAKRFFDILSNPNFIYFTGKPKSVEDEIAFLKTNPRLRKKNIEWNYSILVDGYVVGAVGIKINQQRPFIGEIGYFLDEAYWNRGIATEAVKLAEKEGFGKLGLSRIEIVMQPENVASEKVAIKAGYHREGLMRRSIRGVDGKTKDACLYAKIKEN